jgi:hypothetical protein
VHQRRPSPPLRAVPQAPCLRMRAYTVVHAGSLPVAHACAGRATCLV